NVGLALAYDDSKVNMLEQTATLLADAWGLRAKGDSDEKSKDAYAKLGNGAWGLAINETQVGLGVDAFPQIEGRRDEKRQTPPLIRSLQLKLVGVKEFGVECQKIDFDVTDNVSFRARKVAFGDAELSGKNLLVKGEPDPSLDALKQRMDAMCE